MTLSLYVPRRLLYLLYGLVALLVLYIISYGIVRTTGVMIHITSNTHNIVSGGTGYTLGYSPLELFYAPLRGVEYLFWSLVQPL